MWFGNKVIGEVLPSDSMDGFYVGSTNMSL